MNDKKLDLEVYYGTRPPWFNTTLLFSEDQALVIDAQFQKTDAQAVAQRIKDAGKTLTTILLTHSHPDHAWGGAELLKIFPEAKAYARPTAIQEIELEFLGPAFCAGLESSMKKSRKPCIMSSR